jgi:hypothetical protein
MHGQDQAVAPLVVGHKLPDGPAHTKRRVKVVVGSHDTQLHVSAWSGSTTDVLGVLHVLTIRVLEPHRHLMMMNNTCM